MWRPGMSFRNTSFLLNKYREVCIFKLYILSSLLLTGRVWERLLPGQLRGPDRQPIISYLYLNMKEKEIWNIIERKKVALLCDLLYIFLEGQSINLHILIEGYVWNVSEKKEKKRGNPKDLSRGYVVLWRFLLIDQSSNKLQAENFKIRVT